jgi:hypothetical protein
VSARYGSRSRARSPDAARVMLAIVLIALTALVAMLGGGPPTP